MRNDASQGCQHKASLDRQDRPAGNKSPAGANLRHQIHTWAALAVAVYAANKKC